VVFAFVGVLAQLLEPLHTVCFLPFMLSQIEYFARRSISHAQVAKVSHFLIVSIVRKAVQKCAVLSSGQP